MLYLDYMCVLLFVISDQLRRHYNIGRYWLEVDLEDLTHFDAGLAEKITKQPAEHLQLVSSFSSYELLQSHTM